MEGHQKTETNLPCDPAIPFLGIYLKEYKSAYKRDTCTAMFIAALFTIAKPWNQATTNKWIKKMWYLYTTEYYSTIKYKEIMSFAGKLVELEITMLS
jgi:hypothetical protein